MLIEDSFTVPVSAAGLWTVLQDVEQLAPCLPGAELTEIVDERTWKGRVHVKFGPVQMAFGGTVVMEERDDDAHRARLTAKGTEQRGKGAATAKVESWLESAGEDSTTVNIRSDITITGSAAQLSRGLLPEISKQLTRQFAECLEAKLRSGAHGTSPASVEPSTSSPVPPTPRAVDGVGLGVRALWAKVRAFFAHLFGRDRS